jgi:hypothetical protein
VIAALIVSTLTLWFTTLKGPDIDLCEKPVFSQEVRGPFDAFIPDTILYSSNLVFLNNGTVSGTLGLDACFEPSKELAPYFKNATFQFGTEPHRYTSSASMPPISIADKESAVIYIESTVELHDWKKHFSHEPVSKEQIRDVLCQADRENKKRFSDFCATIREGMHIGTISIKSRQSTRRWFGFRSPTMKEQIMIDGDPIGTFNEDLINNFRAWRKRWDTIDPNVILMELRPIRENLMKELSGPIEGNLKQLEGSDPNASLWSDLLRAVRNSAQGCPVILWVDM